MGQELPLIKPKKAKAEVVILSLYSGGHWL